MSLVAYASSDDSDGEGTSSKQGAGGLFSLLPAPKRASPADSHLLGLPKPKKRTGPVKIGIPHNNADSDDEEPEKKKIQPKAAGSGLSSLLPQPKNLNVKATDRRLIPHALTKRPESNASPSAIKAAAKSAARQLARHIVANEEHEEDISPQNYFSLGDGPEPPTAPVLPSPQVEPVAAVVEPLPAPLPAPLPPPLPPPPPGDDSGQSDAPLDFGGGQEGAAAWGNQYPQYQQPMAGPESYHGGYDNNEAYLPDPSPGLPDDQQPGNSAMFDEEAFMRLQGKRNRGKEEVKFLEIKGDDQLIGHQQWLTKSISEEKKVHGSFSKKKGGMPTGQQRRKHQITYLIHQAKERELELKNTWAENRMTRRQTQAKYGF
ncbi:proline-rich protein PRCC [Stigmatopora nigra]